MPLFTQFLKEVGPVKLAFTVLFALIILIMGGVYFYRSAHNENVVLFSNLAIEDSNKIVQELEAKGISYELVGGGQVIKVPQDKVLKLRIALAEQMLPGKGNTVGYEIFDKGESLTTSGFLQNINYLRSLEGELSRTIASIDQIEVARVHLVIPRKELFSRDRQDPKASIVIKMKGDTALSKPEVNAIAYLVATAVPELDVKQVSIVDTKGRPLKLGNRDEADTSFLASQGQEYKAGYETRLKSMIEDLLENSAGVGKVKAYVTADINFDRIVTNSEKYDPDGSVVRSVQSSQEKEKSSQNDANKDVSVANNLPDSQGGGSDKSTNNIERNEETTNYEISKTIENFIRETGKVNKLSIAVVVDGSYKISDDKTKYEYVPRTKEELDKYVSLVKSAVGFQNERDNLEIVNMQFIGDLDTLVPEDPMDWVKSELPSMIQKIMLGVVVLLVMILVVKPVANKAFDVTTVDVDKVTGKKDALSMLTESLERQEQTDTIENLKDAIAEPHLIEKAMASNNVNAKRLNELVRKNPQETVAVLRRWLAE